MTTSLKVGIVCALVVAVAAVMAIKSQRRSVGEAGTSQAASHAPPAPPVAPASARVTGLPRLVDLGAHSCVPCKEMAPILDELRKEFEGRLHVEFIDVWQRPEVGQEYGIRLIPTQIFYDATGQERARHEGFMSKEDILAKWGELGVSLAPPSAGVVRESPLIATTRPADQACFMCDSDIAARTLVTVSASSGTRRFCSPHCFFIYLSSLPTPGGIEEATTVTDSQTGRTIAAATASYRYTLDADGRPMIEAVAGTNVAGALTWEKLKEKELSVRCAFCDRASYPEDSSRVKVGGAHMHACCPVCGLGVAARLRTDIELVVKDALTGQPLRITTLNGSVASLDPTSLVAWHGQKKSADGAMVSAGCFKQYFFASPEHLRQWMDLHPEATGRQATIGQLLADKMKLSPQQIKNACKIGDCAK